MDKFQYEFQNFLLKTHGNFPGPISKEKLWRRKEKSVSQACRYLIGMEEEDLYGAAGLCADVLAMLLIASAQ